VSITLSQIELLMRHVFEHAFDDSKTTRFVSSSGVARKNFGGNGRLQFGEGEVPTISMGAERKIFRFQGCL
jgi:hypothetical protein